MAKMPMKKKKKRTSYTDMEAMHTEMVPMKGKGKRKKVKRGKK